MLFIQFTNLYVKVNPSYTDEYFYDRKFHYNYDINHIIINNIGYHHSYLNIHLDAEGVNGN